MDFSSTPVGDDHGVDARKRHLANRFHWSGVRAAVESDQRQQ
jgi:hypothetical protein